MTAITITSAIRRGRRAASLALAVSCAVVLLPAAPAHAGWSAPQSFTAAYASARAVAVNARGDAVLAWSSRRRAAGIYRASVSVVVRTAAGKTRVRRLWARRRAEVTGLSAAIDARGRTTVAFVHWDRTKNVPSAIVRAVRRTPSGRWSGIQVVGKVAEGAPALAVGAGGELLLAWEGRFGARDLQRPAIAWARPGGAFGSARELSRSSRRIYDPDGPHAAFDARGTAYVWGSCDPLVFRAPRGSYHFGSPVVLAPNARSFSLSVIESGAGVASWVDGRCSFDVEAAPTTGPVFASALRAGTFGTPVRLSLANEQAVQTTAVALPGGRGALSWTGWHAQTNRTELFGAGLAPGGVFSGVTPLTTGLRVLAADAGGDALLAPVGVPEPSGPLVMRPAGGDVYDPAPTDSREASSAVSTPRGRGAALVWPATFHNDLYAPHQRLVLSIWQP